MNNYLAQRIITFSVLAIIIGYLISLTFTEEMDPTPEIYYKYEDPILKKIRDSQIAKSPILIDTVSVVYFDIGSSEILDSNSILYVAKHSLANTIFVKGHTDNSGLEATNLKLSNKRANNVCDLLAKFRCLGTISGEGYGASCPKAPNDIEANKKYNRRTEILWKKKQNE